jgi:hypothetical protein
MQSRSLLPKSPPFTAEGAKAALVAMLREAANRDAKRCREVWGSPEAHRLLAEVPIMKNNRGEPRIGAFEVTLEQKIYRFWAGEGVFWYEGSFVWRDGQWHATEPREIGKGCIIGQGSR